jgi:integrase
MKKPKAITNAQAEKLIRRLEYRDQLLLRLAIESGLRIGDLLKLTVGQIKQTMTVYETKSRRERTFKISPELFQDLKKYTKYKKRASILFHSSRSASKCLHRSTIHRRIKKALRGLKFNASAHSARKLFAYNKFAETQSLKKVQETMNHRNLMVTLAYLDIDPSEIMLHGGNEVRS